MEYKIKPVLIVTDVQNCFVANDGSFDKLGYNVSKYQKIVPNIKNVYSKFKKMGLPVIFLTAVHEKSGVDLLDRTHKILTGKRRERVNGVPICARDTWDSKIIDELKPDENDTVVEKVRDSAFEETDLEVVLKSLNVDTLIFTGVDTAICVNASLRDAFNKGWDVILLSDCTASLNDDHYKMTLDQVEEDFGLVMESGGFLDNLKWDGNNEVLLKVD